MSFETHVFGKWILAGEHAVLRNVPALVFPVFGRSLYMAYKKGPTSLQVHFEGTYGGEYRLLFWGVVERALELLNRNREELIGQLTIRNEIPVGAGMGASAALCVGLSRWFVAKGWLEENGIPAFATELENLFHGESSGVDVAVSFYGRGIKFQRGKDCLPIQIHWRPQWALYPTGQKGITAICIQQVHKLWQEHEDLAQYIDREMKEAVNLAEKALLMRAGQCGQPLLADAIKKAAHCFDQWGLITVGMRKQMDELYLKGALAVKPTGSGLGGFLLALWPQDQESLGEDYIQI